MSIEETYRIITILVIIGHTQSSLENLLLAIKLPSFNNYSLNQRELTSRYMRWSKFAFDAPGIWVFSVLKLLLGITVLCLAIIDGPNPVLLILLLIIDLLTFPRWRFLIVSEVPMQRVIFVAIIIHAAFSDTTVSAISLYFISAQLLLCYFAAGWQKLKDPIWRNGESMANFFGNFLKVAQPHWLLQQKEIVKWLGWSIIIFECCFWISLAGSWVTWLFLMFGLIFHGILLIRRSLNFFFWAFISAYPAILFTSDTIYALLFE